MIVGIIPARFASTRLMGKPLAEIGDRPLIQHTYESASQSKLLNKIIIAVDDKKVSQVCRDFGAEVITTPKSITTGSDRIAHVAKKLNEADNNSTVVKLNFDQKNNDFQTLSKEAQALNLQLITQENQYKNFLFFTK